jgi:CRISPR-associated protein (TIGR03984 family)
VTTLYSYRAEGTTLSEAIEASQKQLDEAIALLYSPDSCQFLKLVSNDFHDSNGNVGSNLSHIFEARIFTPDHELRWLNRENGKGDAVFLTEKQQTINSFQEFQCQIEDVLLQQYLLWGEPVLDPHNIQEGWQRLAEARIGKLDIPLNQPLERPQRVYLKTREYLNTVDDYGNFGVVEERLVTLEAVS